MPETCIGWGHRENRCGRPSDLELNRAGLWCSNCERARRIAITKQMAVITRDFEEIKRDA